MGLGSFFGNAFAGAISLGQWHPFGNKSKNDPYAALMAQLNPLIQSQTDIAKKQSDAGLINTAEARSSYDYVNKYLKTILTGNDDEILKLIDAGGATKNIDENEQMLSELGVRGGARAANLGQSSFNRDAALSRVLEQLRSAAPGQIAQIGQAIGNLGLGELSASSGASAQASNVIFGVEQLKQADADRKAALIGSIFEAIGSVAGGLACLGLDSVIEGWNEDIILGDLKVGDIVASYDENGNKISRTVIRTRYTEQQPVNVILSNLKATFSHVFFYKDLSERPKEDLPILGTSVDDVKIFKLDDEENNYSFKANGFLSCDDDCLK